MNRMRICKETIRALEEVNLIIIHGGATRTNKCPVATDYSCHYYTECACTIPTKTV